jgi:hypothetical protein
LKITEIALPNTFCLFDGADVVYKHFKLDVKTTNIINNRALKEKVDNFAKVQNAMMKIADISLIQQQRRMEREEEDGLKITATAEVQSTEATINKEENNIQLYKQTQAKLHRELKSLSDNKAGFIMWLDYSNPTLPPIRDIQPPPFHPQIIIDKLNLEKEKKDKEKKDKKEKKEKAKGKDKDKDDESNEEEEDEEEEEDNDEVIITQKSNEQQQNKKKTAKTSKEEKNNMLKGAKAIAATAKYVLDDIKNDSIKVRDPDEEITLDWFTSFHMTSVELEFYKSRSTTMKVLQLLAILYDTKPKWELFPLPELSAADQKRITNIRIVHQKQLEYASKISTSLLVPLGIYYIKTKLIL